MFLLGEITEVVEKVEVEVEDYEKLARELENASPLEIMDKALEKFGTDIAIAFRYFTYLLRILYTCVVSEDVGNLSLIVYQIGQSSCRESVFTLYDLVVSELRFKATVGV